MSKIQGRIEIYRDVEKRIDGRPSTAKEVLYSPFAEILSLIGVELYQSMSIGLENTLIFKVRFCKDLEKLQKNEDWKVIYNNEIYSIFSPDFSKYPYKYVLLKCKRMS